MIIYPASIHSCSNIFQFRIVVKKHRESQWLVCKSMVETARCIYKIVYKHFFFFLNDPLWCFCIIHMKQFSLLVVEPCNVDLKRWFCIQVCERLSPYLGHGVIFPTFSHKKVTWWWWWLLNQTTTPGWWFGTWIFIFPYIGNNHPNWLSYSSEGLKPPTRLPCLMNVKADTISW